MKVIDRNLSVKGASWDSILLASIRIVTTVVSIVITKILSIGLALEDYGTYSQALLIVSVGTSSLMLGLSDALNYYYNGFYKDEIEQRNTVVNTIFFIEILFGIVLALLFILGRCFIADYFNNNLLLPIIVIIAIKPLLENVIYLLQVLFVSIGKAKLIALRNLIISIVKVVIICISVLILKDIKTIFVCLILIDLSQIIVFYFYYQKTENYINPFKSSKKYIIPIFRFGIPMGIFTVTNSLARDVDKLIIGRLTNTETLAIYTNCSKILPFDIIIVAFATVLMPYIMKQVASNKNKEVELLFKNYLRIGYFSAWILGSSVFATSNQVICFLYSSEFLTGKSIFLCYTLDSMIKFASMHLIITATGKTRTLMLYSISTLIVNFILSIILFYLIGIMGPAISTLLTSIIYTILILQKSIRIISSKWRNIFDFKEILFTIILLVIVGYVMGKVNLLLINYGFNQYVSMIFTIIIIIIIDFLAVYKKVIDSFKVINNL